MIKEPNDNLPSRDTLKSTGKWPRSPILHNYLQPALVYGKQSLGHSVSSFCSSDFRHTGNTVSHQEHTL